MTTFLQLHLLTAYPASNLNRDDTGSPKSMKFGGVERLRVSSQSLKRAIRTSNIFAAAMGRAMETPATPTFADAVRISLGARTKTIVAMIVDEACRLKPELKERRVDVLAKVKAALAKIESSEGGGEEAEDSAEEGKGKKGKGKKDKNKDASKLTFGSLDTKSSAGDTNEAVHLGPDEIARCKDIARRLAAGEVIDHKSATVLLEKPKAADIAMFGRMLADNPGYNVEAAVQVAHAFTTHGAAIEDDYFTAVDDLKSLDRAKDRGAGFISVNEFGSGVFYLYVCIDTNLLLKNLSDDKDLTKATLAAFVEAATKVSPSGKQNSYASRARAHFAMIERGSEAPRTLAAAFLKPVGMEGRDGIEESVKRLRQLREQFGRGYDEKFDAMAELDVAGDKGSLQEIITVATGAVDAIT